MTLEAHLKAQEIHREMEMVRKEARTFRFDLNMMALRSQCPQKFGAHALAKKLRLHVDEWEQYQLDELQRLFDAL